MGHFRHQHHHRDHCCYHFCRRSKPWLLALAVLQLTFHLCSGHAFEQQQLIQADSSDVVEATTTAAVGSVTLPPCEPKVLEDLPPDPFYDVSDLTIQAAKAFADFLAAKRIDTSKDDRKLSVAREKANELASYVLKEDSGLLAVGIASPRLPLAVVQFRDKIDAAHANLSESKTFLSTYWRELGAAWNQTNGAQFWGAPFRDCGPLYGRWLWPFSVTVESQGYK